MLPVSAPPINHGAVLVDDRGRIVAIGPDANVPTPDDAQVFDYPNAAIIPGLVNTHTHLELTDIGGPLEAQDFVEWINTIRREVAARSPHTLMESARQGVRDTWRCGTTTVADTGSSGTVARALSEMGGRGVAYQEVFGPSPDICETAMAGLREKYEQLMDYASDRVTIGVSPHAPYSVSGRLYEAVADFATSEGVPVAAHIAESHAETELIVNRGGPFAAALQKRGIAAPEKAASPIRYLARHKVLDTGLLAIHCVQVDGDDCILLQSRGCSVASCPTSNRMHGHGPPPLRTMVDAGIRVAVGTDSVASVGALDMFREARAARDALALSADATLRLVTLDAASVLNMENTIGSLDVGKWGDMTVVALRPSGGAPIEQVVGASPRAVMATFVAGRCVFAAKTPTENRARGDL